MASLWQRGISAIAGLAVSAVPAPPIAFIDERSDDFYLLTEDRSIENPAVPLSQITSWDSFFGGPTFNSLTKETITSETALRVSAVYACINLIANTVSMLPRGVYTETQAGREIDRKHPLQQLFYHRPNQFMNWVDFLHTMVAAALANGNAYALIERDREYNPIGLRYLKTGQCSPIYVDAGPVHYLYYSVFGQFTEPRDIIHIRCLGSDGVIGKSPIALFAESIGLALGAEHFGARLFGQGANMSGVLETTQPFKDQGAIDRLRSQFATRYAGPENAHKPLILEQGMKYQRISIPPNEAQFIETRNFQIEDIARIYGVPQHKIGKLDRSTNNNIEQQAKEFVTHTILPWTERIRQEFETKLLAESEKESKEVVFDFDFLLKGDSAARAAYYQSRFATGSITPNEVRRKENDNQLNAPGMDDTYMQQGFAPVRTVAQAAPNGATNTPTPPKKRKKTNPTTTPPAQA